MSLLLRSVRLRYRSSLVFPRYVRMAAGLLRDGLRREMWTAVRLVDGSTFRLEGTMGYGMGWIVDDRAGHRSVGHSGSCTVVTRTRTR